MFDLGWTELLVIGIVALIVVGPKDLPVLFRNVGRWVGKAKGMAREFSRAMNDAADEAGVSDVSKTIKAATNPVGSALDGVKDAARDMTSGFDPTKAATSPTPTPKMSPERTEQIKKIQSNTALVAAERRAREAAEALEKARAEDAALKAYDAPAKADQPADDGPAKPESTS